MEGGTYIQQRQSILDISMYKLRMPPVRRTEPSLRRSVLIYNTLRVIEHELQQEGVAPPPVSPSLFQPLQEDDMDPMNLDPIPGATDHPPRPDCPLPCPTSAPLSAPIGSSSQLGVVAALPPVRTPFCTPMECSPEAPPTPAPPIVQEDNHSLHQEEPETEPEPIIHTLQPVTNATKLASSSADVLLNNDRGALSSLSSMFDLDYSRTGPMPLLPMPALPNGCSVQSHLSSSHHRQHHNPNGQTDIFGDIDLTLYDFDLFSSFSSNVKMAPLSAEELMHSFPTDAHPSQLSSPSPCYRNELLNDDLDHIMQVLVGI